MPDSLMSPMILAFALGIIAARLKSDLKFPDSLYTSLTIYLMIAIGMKGGYKLSITPFSEVLLPALAAILLSCLIPLWVYWTARKIGRLGTYNAAALAAHYGSVSVVTFSTAVAYLENLEVPSEGFMPALLAMMEIPAILVAIGLSRWKESRNEMTSALPMKELFRELLVGKGSVLLIGFMLIGYLSGPKGWEQVSPLLDLPFKGVLTFFLLEAGLVAGGKLSGLKKQGVFLVAFGILMPLLHSVVGIYIGQATGLSMGGAVILGVLTASASYIAAPAACRVALPEASPSLYLTASLAITFPFNITIGIPLYHKIAELMFR